MYPNDRLFRYYLLQPSTSSFTADPTCSPPCTQALGFLSLFIVLSNGLCVPSTQWAL